MSNRIKTVPSLVLAAFLVSVFSTAIAWGAARAADNCLKEPRLYSPPGLHWYFRIDGPNHRKCWFLGDEGQKVIPAGSQRSSTSSPLSQPRRTIAAIQLSAADAHAELPLMTTPMEPAQGLGPARMPNLETNTEVASEVSPSEMSAPPSERDPEGESGFLSNGMIDAQPGTESRTELVSVESDQERAAAQFAEETRDDQLRLRLALLLIVPGLAIIAGCLIFKLFAARKARRRASSRQTDWHGFVAARLGEDQHASVRRADIIRELPRFGPFKAEAAVRRQKKMPL